MIDKKKITSSVHRPDFKIYQIIKLEGIKRTDNKKYSDRFSSPIFGTKVPDKIVVPEIQDILGNPGKRLDAFRDRPQVKNKDDYSEFNIINNQTRTKVLGGKEYFDQEQVFVKEEVFEEPKIIEPIKFKPEPVVVEKEEEVVEKKSVFLEPLQEVEEPKPGIIKSNNFTTKAGFEDLDSNEEVIEVKKEVIKPSVSTTKNKQKYIKPDPKIFKIRALDTEAEPAWLLEQIDILTTH